MYNHDKLRGRIVEKFGSARAFANALGISNTALSCKLNNKTGISREDITKWAEMLSIVPEEIGCYFFDLTVKRS